MKFIFGLILTFFISSSAWAQSMDVGSVSYRVALKNGKFVTTTKIGYIANLTGIDLNLKLMSVYRKDAYTGGTFNYNKKLGEKTLGVLPTGYQFSNVVFKGKVKPFRGKGYIYTAIYDPITGQIFNLYASTKKLNFTNLIRVGKSSESEIEGSAVSVGN